MTAPIRAALAKVRTDRDLIAAGRCPCDPTRGQTCRNCDGLDDGSRDVQRAPGAS